MYREAPTDKSDWWELYEPFEETLSDGSTILIPAGYVTDFASVPMLLWSFFPPIGKYNRAALVHDYLYDLQYRQKELGEKLESLRTNSFCIWLTRFYQMIIFVTLLCIWLSDYLGFMLGENPNSLYCDKPRLY
jgi:hypothetical protein